MGRSYLGRPIHLLTLGSGERKVLLWSQMHGDEPSATPALLDLVDYAVAEAGDEPLPVSVMLGGPPALILSAIAPLPENVPEILLASLIAGERLGVVGGVGAHPLVAGAEIALTGRGSASAPRLRPFEAARVP